MQDNISTEANGTSDISEQGIITTHRISEYHDKEKKTLNFLHSDIFDSRTEIVVSALSALSEIGTDDSLKYLVKLFTSNNYGIKIAAIKAAGGIGGNKAKEILIELFKTVQDEDIRCEVLESLSKFAAKDPEVEALIKVFSSSQLIGESTKARMIGLMIDVNDEIDIRPIINQAQPGGKVLYEIYKKAADRDKIKSPVVEHAIKVYARLNPQEKKLLVKAASPFNNQQAEKLLIELLMDIQPEVRKECYSVLGTDKRQVSIFPKVIEFLMDGVEDDPELEEEARKAILRMEEVASGTIKVSSVTGNKLIEKIKDLFQKVKQGSNRVVSDTHELGWLIVHSKEYLEYYGNEDFKHAIVSYLKGSGNYSMNALLRELRATAVKVEVRHFDGYNALTEIIKNPKRPGAALIARELAIAKLGKRRDMYHLMRNLYITRMFNMKEMEDYFFDIYKWARTQKLFRLAEAALYATAKINEATARELIKENITPPIMSKILAIASFKLIRYYGWSGFEDATVRLLEETTDHYVMLNLLDALLGTSAASKSKIVQAVMKRFSFETEEEIVFKLSNVIEQFNDPALIDNLMNIYTLSNEDKKYITFQTMRNILLNKEPIDKDALINFLYRVIKEDKNRCKGYAAGLLYILNDDYSIKVIKDIVIEAENEGKIALLQCLEGNINKDIVSFFKPLFFNNDLHLHENFRRMVELVQNSDVGSEFVEIVVDVRSRGLESIDSGVVDSSQEDIKKILLKDKEEYKFEREHIKKLYVLFTDIVGYTKMSQQLSSIEISSLIKEYEGILIPILTKHNGELVKRIGDGHLFVFHRALDAVLGAIRLQKAIKRFNSFREERLRVQIRIGIHGGEVIMRGNDVLGNTVNLASRLEESAEPGSIYVSNDVYEEVKDYIHAKEIGELTFKGIEYPVKVFEPYEISVNLPKELDPTKGARAITGDSESKTETKEYLLNNERYEKLFNYFKNTLGVINTLCGRVEKGEATIKDIKIEIAKRWKLLQKEFQNI